MSDRFGGEVALITGGASGIGAATVRRMAEEGAQVMICDIQVEPGEALAKELGETVQFRATDVRDSSQVDPDIGIERRRIEEPDPLVAQGFRQPGVGRRLRAGGDRAGQVHLDLRWRGNG